MKIIFEGSFQKKKMQKGAWHKIQKQGQLSDSRRRTKEAHNKLREFI